MAEQTNFVYYVSSIDLNISIEGGLLSTGLNQGPIELEVTIHGSMVTSIVINVSPIVVQVSLVKDYMFLSPPKSNWVKWSKIGYLDFTVDESNVAGERPLDWYGRVYEILKLDKTPVVYGENGVTILIPSNVNYGIQTINRVGVVCKTAVAGTESAHYFIDRSNKLCELSGEGLKLLDYSEYLEKLTDPKMILDIETGLLYICDGTRGYVYSTQSRSFGKGPANITGIGSKSGTLYVSSDGEIVYERMHICTDIYDLGTRKPKTIQYVEFGTDLTNNLEAMIECRVSNKANFLKSKWFLVNPSGIAYIPCYGVEFKFHLRSYIYEYLELDYIKVNGVIHGFNMMESV